MWGRNLRSVKSSVLAFPFRSSSFRSPFLFARCARSNTRSPIKWMKTIVLSSPEKEITCVHESTGHVSLGDPVLIPSFRHRYQTSQGRKAR